MPALSTHRVTNANVYLDGNSLFGQVAEATLPELKKVMVEHAALGLIGKPEYVAGLDKMEAKFKFNAIYADAMKAAAGHSNTVKLQLRSSIEVYQGGEKTDEQPYVAFLTGQFTNMPAGGFKAMDNVDIELSMSVTAMRIEINRDEIVNIDVNANIWITGGSDQLQLYRDNLGL